MSSSREAATRSRGSGTWRYEWRATCEGLQPLTPEQIAALVARIQPDEDDLARR